MRRARPVAVASGSRVVVCARTVHRSTGLRGGAFPHRRAGAGAGRGPPCSVMVPVRQLVRQPSPHRPTATDAPFFVVFCREPDALDARRKADARHLSHDSPAQPPPRVVRQPRYDTRVSHRGRRLGRLIVQRIA